MLSHLTVFNNFIAMEIGITNAILIGNIHYWVNHNKQNNINFHEGRYWTYNTQEAYSEQFPYLTRRQIQTALKKLEEEGYIMSDNFNQKKYDRTKWYTLTDKGIDLIISSDRKAIELTQKSKQCTNLCNGMHQNVQPIPYNNHISNITIGVVNSSEDEKVKANASKKKKLKPTDIHIEINKHYVSMDNALKGCKATSQEFIRNINTLLETYSVEDIKDVISFKNEDAYTNEKSKKYFVPSTIFRLSNFEKTYEFMLQWKNKKNSVGTSNTVQSKKYFVWLGDRLTSQDAEPARGTEYFLSEEEALKNKPI